MPTPKKRKAPKPSRKTATNKRKAVKPKGNAQASKRNAGKSKEQPIYQFKITLLGSKPPIWRRILVPEGTLDDLHEHIQTAMGWTNSHLHQFTIDGVEYGDPEPLREVPDEEFVNSTETWLSEVFAKRPPRFRFQYEYDFGDGWGHLLEFEGTPPIEADVKYPACIDGRRACPPEDVGGVWGYEGFLEAIRNPKHKEHESYLEWIGGEFDAEEFDSTEATKRMSAGVPDWGDFG